MMMTTTKTKKLKNIETCFLFLQQRLWFVFDIVAVAVLVAVVVVAAIFYYCTMDRGRRIRFSFCAKIRRNFFFAFLYMLDSQLLLCFLACLILFLSIFTPLYTI